MNALIIFVLLFALMLTFLFTMISMPIESVALKLFTGIEKFEIMAIPFSSWRVTFSRMVGWRGA